MSAVTLEQAAEAMCRGVHPTRWEYRASASACDECTAGAAALRDASLLGDGRVGQVECMAERALSIGYLLEPEDVLAALHVTSEQGGDRG